MRWITHFARQSARQTSPFASLCVAELALAALPPFDTPDLVEWKVVSFQWHSGRGPSGSSTPADRPAWLRRRPAPRRIDHVLHEKRAGLTAATVKVCSAIEKDTAMSLLLPGANGRGGRAQSRELTKTVAVRTASQSASGRTVLRTSVGLGTITHSSRSVGVRATLAGDRFVSREHTFGACTLALALSAPMGVFLSSTAARGVTPPLVSSQKGAIRA